MTVKACSLCLFWGLVAGLLFLLLQVTQGMPVQASAGAGCGVFCWLFAMFTLQDFDWPPARVCTGSVAVAVGAALPFVCLGFLGMM